MPILGVMELVILAFLLLIGPLAVRYGADSRVTDTRERRGPWHRLGAPTAAVWAALGAIYVIWGATYLGMEIAIESIPPFLMASIRFLVAGAILFAIFRPRSARPTLHHWIATAIVGTFLLVGGNALVAVSQQRIDTGVAALIVATFPLWIATFDFAANGRRLRPLAIVGVVVGFVGIALLIRPGGDIDLLGALICLFAPISWTIGSLYARGARLPDNLLLGSGMEMLAGGAVSQSSASPRVSGST